jgi:hypothetical protein
MDSDMRTRYCREIRIAEYSYVENISALNNLK